MIYLIEHNTKSLVIKTNHKDPFKGELVRIEFIITLANFVRKTKVMLLVVMSLDFTDDQWCFLAIGKWRGD